MKHMLMMAAVAAALAVEAVEVTKDWQIAVPEGGEPAVRNALRTAAEEIQRDIEEALGWKLPIVKTSAAKGPAFFLGNEAAEKAGLRTDDLKGLENVYAEKDGSVYLFGHEDRAGHKGVASAAWWYCVLPTVRATVRFLKDRLGVRYVQYGVTGTDVPKAERLTLDDGAFSREMPHFDYGAGRFHGLIYDYANYIFGAGAYWSYGGHSYEPAVPADKYYKDHPEYFGLLAGKRVYMKHGSILCISNPEVQQLMVDELCRKFDEGVDVCQLGQQDGFRGCECEKCAAFGGPEAKDWGEKLWILHADIARRLEKLRPGKIVHIMSYGPTAHPPRTFKVFPSNVMIERCYYTEQAFKEWTGYTVPHGFTIYSYFWGEYPRMGFTPKMTYARAAVNVQRFLKNGVHGLYRCGFGELFGMEGPGYYVFNGLLENPQANVNAIVTEYCDRSFGPASPLMRRFYDRLDQRLQLWALSQEGWPADIGNGLEAFRTTVTGNALPLFAQAYTPQAIAEMENCLARAERHPDLTDKQRRRLALVRMEWNYTKNLAEIATFYAAYRQKPCPELFRPLAEKVKERNAYIDWLFSGPKKDLPRGIEGWPELVAFGNYRRPVLATNGKMTATIGAPLCWNVDFLLEKGICPGASFNTLTVKKSAAAPSGLDFESGEWAKAEWQTLGGHHLESLKHQAKFKMLHDGEALYVAVESDIDKDRGARVLGHDDKVWIDDTIDLTLDPTGERDSYFHILWTPYPGAVFDSNYGMIADPLHPKFAQEDSSWNSTGATFENGIADGKWKALARIPFATLNVKCPAAGEKWCANVGREWNFTAAEALLERGLWNANTEAGTLSHPAAMGFLVFE